MQSLDAAVHYFGKTCLLGNFDDVKASFSQLPAGTASGKYLYTEFGKASYKRNQSALVRNTDQRASYVEHAVTWREMGRKGCATYRISE